MIKKLLFIAAILPAISAQAQLKERGTLSLSFGPSFATGDFGNDDITGSSSGIAKTGLSIDIGYTYPIKKNFSLAAMFHGQQNALNTEALENTFSNTRINNGVFFSNGSTMPPPQSGTIYPNWKFSKDNWKTLSLLVGGQAQIPMGGKGLYFLGRLLLGPTYATSPKVEGSSITDTATARATQTSEHGWGLGYMLGAGVRYDVSSKFFLTGRLDAFGTNKITFKDIVATLITTRGNSSNPAGWSVSQSQFTADGKQKITSINLSAGIGLRL